ncbi:MAG: Ig-like domain-containing protein [Planctomycetota bacterium]
MFRKQYRPRNRRQRHTRLRFEQLEQRRLLAGDIVDGADAVSADTLKLQERFGTLDVGVEVVNLANDQCIATVGSGWSESCRQAVAENTVPETPSVHVGDVLAVYPVVDDTTTDVRVPSLLVWGHKAVQLAYEPHAFEVLPRDSFYVYGQVIVQEVGTWTLAPVTTEVPDGLSLLSGTLDKVLADPGLAAYLEQFVNIHPVDIQVTPADVRPTARDDRYTFVSDSTVDGKYEMSVTAESGVLANDFNPFDQPLNVILIDRPEYGSVRLNEDGSFRYGPSLSYIGDDHFTYVAGGTDGTSEIRTVTIVDTQHPPLIQLELRAINDAGEPITSVRVGEEYTVQLLAHSPGTRFARDDRVSTGLLTFAPEVASPLGDVQFNPEIGLLNLETMKNADGSLALLSNTDLPESRNIDDATIGIDLWLLGDRLEGDEESGFTKVPRGTYEVLRSRFVANAAGEMDLSLLTNIAVTSGAGGQKMLTGDLGRLVDVTITPLTVRPGSIWQNPIQPLDVNDDGAVSPLDALVAINRINDTHGGAMPEARVASDRNYPDTNGDGDLSPVDVLLIVNHLNAVNASGAEGEGIRFAPVVNEPNQPEPMSLKPDGNPATELLRISSASSPSISQVPQQTRRSVDAASAQNASNDLEADLLQMLADDLVTRWN